MNLNYREVEKHFRRTQAITNGIATFQEAVSVDEPQILQIVDYDEAEARKIEFEELS